MPNYLLYQAYGNPDILNEAVFSILSYTRQPDATAQIILYTDNPSHFTNLWGEWSAVQYVPVAAAQWQAWRGDIDFVHRVKIEVLQHAAAHYAGNLLYLDTDTIFQASAAPIFAAIGRGERWMHVSEGSLASGTALSKKINRVLQAPDVGTLLPGGPVAPGTLMYNAGVLGFRSTDAPLLAEVLTLTEALYRRYPKHVMEQLAFSVVWARTGTVREAAPWVYHYWNLKEIRPVLARVLAAGAAVPAALAARAGEVDFAGPAGRKAAFRARPGWLRAVLRWLGREWKV